MLTRSMSINPIEFRFAFLTERGRSAYPLHLPILFVCLFGLQLGSGAHAATGYNMGCRMTEVDLTGKVVIISLPSHISKLIAWAAATLIGSEFVFAESRN